MNGKLDLMICDTGMEPPGSPSTVLCSAPLKWITSVHKAPHKEAPLPVCLGPAECPWRPAWVQTCLWRDIALRALRDAGLPFRHESSRTTVAGFDAAVTSGKAVTVSTLISLPNELRHVRDDEGLPQLPDINVLLLQARQPRNPRAATLADFLVTACELA